MGQQQLGKRIAAVTTAVVFALAKKIVKPSEKENRILKNENKFLNATIDELKTRLNTLDSSKDREREIIECE